MTKKIFDDIVAQLVDFERRNRGDTLESIAEILNVDNDYIRKINSAKDSRHYSLYHIFILSQKWEISLDNLLPLHIDTIKQLTQYKDYNNYQFQKLLLEIEKEFKVKKKE